MLCMTNTRQEVGWALCSLVLDGNCSVAEGVKRYNPKSGSSGFHRHVEMHQFHDADDVPLVVPADMKADLVRAAARSVVLDNMPLNFAYHRSGFMGLARTLVNIGQSYAAATSINLKTLLPSGTAVREGVLNLASEYRAIFKEKLPEVLRVGGGISCDGVKVELTGKKYYDFVLNYIEVHRRPVSRGGGLSWKLQTRLLFITPHVGAETAEEIRKTLDECLVASTGKPLEAYEKNFTFVTDCAATMPCVFGASVSPARVPYCERWVGCISHQLNTAMKNAMKHEGIATSIIGQDLERVKKIVTLFKKASLNAEMPEGHALIQEVETRFGTLHDVVSRFMKAEDNVRRVIDGSDVDAATKAAVCLAMIHTAQDREGTRYFPALKAIVTCFAPIRHAQTELEGCKTPTLMKVIPMLEDIKHSLKLLGAGYGQNMETADAYTRTLSDVTQRCLEGIVYHDMWAAACVLHPGLSSFYFVQSTNNQDLKTKGEAQVRRMVRDIRPVTPERPTADTHTPIATVRNNIGHAKWKLSNKMTFDMCSPDADELTAFQNICLSSAEKELLQTDDGVIDFWISKLEEHALLARVALRVLATPASSCASERNFSLLKMVLQPSRSRLKDDILDGIAYLRSAINGEEDDVTNG